jgi:hypothetical protein
MPHDLRLRLEELALTGMRLGRHIDHDLRSAGFAVESVWEVSHPSRPVAWPRRCPIFDQGDLGSCTGNALAGVLGTDWVGGTGAAGADEQLAVDLYSEATRLDRYPGVYPPEDTGSSGLAVCKAAKNRGLIESYRHAFTMHGLITALTRGPVITGINWYSSFDEPGPHGALTIDHNAYVRGGHELEILAYDPAGGGMLRGPNSWGTSWGDGGYWEMSLATFGRLRAEHADVTVPVRF